MSEEQLSALLAKLKEDAGLREKLLGAGDLDAAVAMAKQTLELSDEELEGVAGGNIFKQTAGCGGSMDGCG